MARSVLLLWLFAGWTFPVFSFVVNHIWIPPRECNKPGALNRQLRASEDCDQYEDSKDDKFAVLRPEQQVPLDATLLPPTINLRKESLLFGTNPASKGRNNLLHFWRWCKHTLPYIVTGATAKSTVADDTPLAGIYNMVLVRIPAILAALAYGKNLAESHPLIIDVGNGPWEVPPLIVGFVLYGILR